MPGPSKEVKERLPEDELDGAIDEAQSNGEARLVRRLCLVKNLYVGDSITEAARRAGVSQPTASRWTDDWNEGGVDGLRPDFGGGRPSKLRVEQRDRLVDVLEGHQPLTTGHVQRLVEGAFDVSYSRRHLARLLDDLGMGHAIPSPGSPDQLDDPEAVLEARLQAALDEFDEDVATDGGP